MAFNPLRARGLAESDEEVGTSTRRCQMRKLRPGDSPSTKGRGLCDWTSEPEPRPSTPLLPLGLNVSHLEEREGDKHSRKREWSEVPDP